MRADDTLSELAHLSRRLGANPAYVQGGGGNTSLKTSAGMWIKASGLALAEVTADSGFVLVADVEIKCGLRLCRDDADYTRLLTGHLRAGHGRPSLETGFHAVLRWRAVFHSHAILANLLCCAVDGRAVTADLFPDAVWIDYVTPGLPLTQAVANAADRQDGLSVFFLQNHGLIVAADYVDGAWDAHEAVCRRIQGHFQIDPRQLLFGEALDADAEHVLFPDQVIYLQNEELRSSRAGQETLHAYYCLRRLILETGGLPRYLPVAEGKILNGMEAEQYRQKVAGACL